MQHRQKDGLDRRQDDRLDEREEFERDVGGGEESEGEELSELGPGEGLSGKDAEEDAQPSEDAELGENDVQNSGH